MLKLRAEVCRVYHILITTVSCPAIVQLFQLYPYFVRVDHRAERESRVGILSRKT